MLVFLVLLREESVFPVSRQEQDVCIPGQLHTIVWSCRTKFAHFSTGHSWIRDFPNRCRDLRLVFAIAGRSQDHEATSRHHRLAPSTASPRLAAPNPFLMSHAIKTFVGSAAIVAWIFPVAPPWLNWYDRTALRTCEVWARSIDDVTRLRSIPSKANGLTLPPPVSPPITLACNQG